MRLAGRADRPVDVRLRRVCDLGERLLGGRVDDGERLARLRRPELVANEEAVLRLDPNVIGCLGRRRVLPRVVAADQSPRVRGGAGRWRSWWGHWGAGFSIAAGGRPPC